MTQCNATNVHTSAPAATGRGADAPGASADAASASPARGRTDIRLADLVDLTQIQRLAEANFRASGMPIGLVDATDGSILVGVGWQDICTKFHRLHPVTRSRCEASDRTIQAHIQDGRHHAYKCQNGLWDIGIPIIVDGQHLATLFLGQFIYEDEAIDYAWYESQAREFGFDPAAYRQALDRIPVFTRATVENILSYNQALAGFITSCALSNYRHCRELAARKKAEAALREKAAFIECMMNAIPSPIFFKDMDGVYQNCNDAFAEMLGKDKSEIIGQTVYGVSKGQFAAKYSEMDNRLFHQAGVQTYEWKVVDATGNTRDFLFTKTAFRDENGQPVGLIGIMTDITDRTRAEQALKLSHDQLEERVSERTKALEEANNKLIDLDRMKSSFLNTVSHDIRTPLTSILGFVKLVKKDVEKYLLPHPDLDQAVSRMERAKQNLGIVLQEGERLTRLINDFLDLTKIESGKSKWKDETVYVQDLVRQYVRLVKPTRANKDTVELVVDVEPDMPPVRADPDRVLQVIDNIFGNAVKFTSAGRIAIAARVVGRLVQVRVEDTGIGIPQDDIEHIFEEFYQTHSDTMRDTAKGTGLGLAICKYIVTHYGGRIWATSAPGQGSCVTFELPAANREAQGGMEPLEDTP